jgi:hypothetical protein
MAYTLSSTESEFPEDRWPTKPPIQTRTRPTDRRIEQPSLDKRASRGFARFLIIFCIGVAATLVWQSYGDAAREMIANSSPQLRWLAPQTVAQTAPDMVAPTPPATPSPDVQQLKAISLGLAALRQSVEQLAAAQQQMTDEIAKLQATEQEILDKVSTRPLPAAAPAPAPARKSASPVPPPSSQVPPAR